MAGLSAPGCQGGCWEWGQSKPVRSGGSGALGGWVGQPTWQLIPPGSRGRVRPGEPGARVLDLGSTSGTHRLPHLLAAWCSHPHSLALCPSSLFLCCWGYRCQPSPQWAGCGPCSGSASPPPAVTAGPLPLNGWRQRGGPLHRGHLPLWASLAFADPSSLLLPGRPKPFGYRLPCSELGSRTPWPLRIDPHLLTCGLQPGPGRRCGPGADSQRPLVWAAGDLGARCHGEKTAGAGKPTPPPTQHAVLPHSLCKEYFSNACAGLDRHF